MSRVIGRIDDFNVNHKVVLQSMGYLLNALFFFHAGNKRLVVHFPFGFSETC
jgi:hypothetical protein